MQAVRLDALQVVNSVDAQPIIRGDLREKPLRPINSNVRCIDNLYIRDCVTQHRQVQIAWPIKS